MDPHLYFEQKMLGEIAAARSAAALCDFVSALVGWIDAGGLSVGGIASLDRRLASDNLPTLALWRDAGYRPVAAALLDAQPSSALAKLGPVDSSGLTGADRRLIETVTRGHES